MKLRNLLFLGILLMQLACADDEVLAPEPANIDVTGTWSMTRTVADEELYDINGDGIHSKNLLEEMPCRIFTLHLDADASFILIENSWAYANGNVVCTNITSQEGSWSVNNEATLLSLVVNTNDGSTFEIPEIPIELKDGLLSVRYPFLFFDFDSSGNFKEIQGVSILEPTW